MKVHRSLTRSQLIQKGPAHIAMMVASEFTRAAKWAAQPDSVRSCYNRARELMGVLETIRLPSDIGLSLKPFFDQASERELMSDKCVSSKWVTSHCTAFAQAFEQTSSALES